MRALDTPIRFAFGRTARELVLLAVGVGFTAIEIHDWGFGDPANLAVYAIGVIAFAARFFPARAIGVGVCLGALTQRFTPGAPYPLDWTAYAPFFMLALLASRDLEERFDRAPSGIAWFPNRWAALPPSTARSLRWCAYAFSALGGILWRAWLCAHESHLQPGAWGLVLLGVIVACVLLLAHGRAAVLVAIPLVAAGLAAALVRGDAARLFAATPTYTITAVGLAAIAAAIALPYAFKLLTSAARDR